jgi:hypothetical protein
MLVRRYGNKNVVVNEQLALEIESGLPSPAMSYRSVGPLTAREILTRTLSEL